MRMEKLLIKFLCTLGTNTAMGQHPYTRTLRLFRRHLRIEYLYREVLLSLPAVYAFPSITINIINKRGKHHHQTMSNTVIVLSQLGLLDKRSPPNRTQSEEQEHKGHLYNCNRKGGGTVISTWTNNDKKLHTPVPVSISTKSVP